MADQDPEKKAEPKLPPFAAQAPAVQPLASVPVTGGSGTTFQRVKLTQPLTEPDRDPPNCLVSPTGLTKTNTGGFQVVEGLALRLGLDATFALDYGVNLEKRQVALYPVHGQTAGATPVRRYPKEQLLTIYLKHLFKKYPSLAPRIRQQCSLYLDRDSTGAECVVLALGTGLDKPVVSKNKNGQSKN